MPADALQTGGLLAALLAAFKVLEIAVAGLKKPPAEGSPRPEGAAPPPTWWERIAKVEAQLEMSMMHDADLGAWLLRIEQKLDRLQGERYERDRER